jgi:hypothetical protein
MPEMWMRGNNGAIKRAPAYGFQLPNVDGEYRRIVTVT